MLRLWLRCNIKESMTAISKLGFIENKEIKGKKTVWWLAAWLAVRKRGRSLPGPFKGLEAGDRHQVIGEAELHVKA